MRVYAMLAAGALAVAMGGCGKTPACRAPAAPPSAAHARPYLWEVRGGAAPLWLYGTLHVAGKDDVPRAAWDALAASAVYVSELDDMPESGLEELARLPRGQSLSKLLPADAWFELRDTLEGTVREEELNRLRPWYALSLLLGKLRPPPRPGMGAALRAAAEKQDKQLVFLDTWAQQMGAMDDAVDTKDLLEAIHDRDRIPCSHDAMLAWYRAGDDDALLERLGFAAEDELVGARNDRWVETLEPLARRGGAFVAVGVSHMFGARGLAARLAAEGYQVTRVGAAVGPGSDSPR